MLNEVIETLIINDYAEDRADAIALIKQMRKEIREIIDDYDAVEDYLMSFGLELDYALFFI